MFKSMQQLELDYLRERNKKLEETLRKAYIELKKHEYYDRDIVGDTIAILDERAWSNE